MGEGHSAAQSDWDRAARHAMVSEASVVQRINEAANGNPAHPSPVAGRDVIEQTPRLFLCLFHCLVHPQCHAFPKTRQPDGSNLDNGQLND